MDDEHNDEQGQPGYRPSDRVRIIGAQPARRQAEEGETGQGEAPGTPTEPSADDELPWPRARDDWAAEPEMPHWTDAPTGEIPAVLARDQEPTAGREEDPWSSVPSPTWREEHTDWAADDEAFSPSVFASESRLGALDDSEAAEQPWDFDLPARGSERPQPGAQTYVPDPSEDPGAWPQAGAPGQGSQPAPGEQQPYYGDEPTATFPAVRREPEAPEEAWAQEPAARQPSVDETWIGEPAGESWAPEAAPERSAGAEPAFEGSLAGEADPGAQEAPAEAPGYAYEAPGGGPDAAPWAESEVLATEPIGPVATGPDPSGLDLAGGDYLVESEAAAVAEEERGVPDADELLGPPPRRGRSGRSGRERRRRHGRDRGEDEELIDFGEPAPPPAEEPAHRKPRPSRGGPGRTRTPVAEAPPAQRAPDEALGAPGRRNVPVAIGSGVVIAAIALICFAIGTIASLLLVTVIVTVAAAEGFAAFRRAAQRPATLLGLVAVAALMIATYNKGLQAAPLVALLLVVFGLLWFTTGVERADPVSGTASTLLVFVWVGIFGSYAALLLAPSQFPNRHGIAYLLGAVIVAVAYDVGALAVGAWIGRRPLAPAISPNKTWEGLAGGTVAAIVVALVVVQAIHPWTVGKAFALGIVVAIVAPLGDLCESVVKRHLGLKDMGRLLPGHGGLLDRFDGLLFVLPATFYLVKAFHLG